MGSVSAGQQIGRLRVVSRGAGRTWLCRCECGVWRTVRDDRLKVGRTRSCGCLRRDALRARCIAKVPTLQGQRFGRWLVLERAEPDPESGRSCWRCRCECGVVRVVRQASLRGGRSLGCSPCARRDRRRERDPHSPGRCAGGAARA